MEHALEIASSRENCDYLPGYKPPTIQIGCEVGPVLMEAGGLPCPSKAMLALRLIKPYLEGLGS